MIRRLCDSIDNLARAIYHRHDIEEVRRLVIENGKKLDKLLAGSGTGVDLQPLVTKAQDSAVKVEAAAEELSTLKEKP